MMRFLAYAGAVALVVCASARAPLLPGGPADVVYRRHQRMAE